MGTQTNKNCLNNRQIDHIKLYLMHLITSLVAIGVACHDDPIDNSRQLLPTK